MYDGVPIMTFTNSQVCPKNKPSEEYKKVIIGGLIETYPRTAEADLTLYLEHKMITA